jgi:hypothetical protein
MKDSAYRSGRSPDWLKMKNSDAPAVKREANSQADCNCAYFECSTMLDKLESPDTNEKAAESTLYRCRALVGRTGRNSRKKKPEHFVDERSRAPDPVVNGSQVRDR